MTVVGVDVKTLSLHGAGISTALKAVLPELIARTAEFEWIGLGPSPALAQLPDGLRRVPVELLDRLGPPRLPLYDQWQLRVAARRHRLDLFYSPYFDAPVALPVPTVVTMHDAVHFRFPELYPIAHRVYYRRLMRLHGTHAAAIVTDSEFSKTELVAAAGVDPQRVHVVPLALPRSFRVDPDAPAAGPRYGLPADYVLYTGGVEQRKNLWRLLEAYALWCARRPDAPALVLTGTRDRFAPHLARAVELGIASRIVCPGRVEDRDLANVYAAASAAIYPSLYEGFGFPVLEAMTARVPIACSRRASLPEIGGDAACYFDPESIEDMAAALDRVTGDSELRTRLVEAGAWRAELFTTAATADALSRVLKATVSR